MKKITIDEFSDNFDQSVENVITEHAPLKVVQPDGRDFIVISRADWEREQETIYVLQNQDLMQQIAKSANTFKNNSGYKPSPEQLDEIFGI